MPSRDQEIYQKLAQILYDVMPDGTEKVILKLPRVSRDVVEFEYYAVGADGHEKRFYAESDMSYKMRTLAVDLKDFFVSQNQPPWKGCEFTLDVKTTKLKTRFIYE